MARRFITAGSATIDTITPYGGETASERIGGAVIYSAQGLRLWHDNVSVGIYTGRDFFDYYRNWIENNNIDASGVIMKTEHTRRLIINYRQNGFFLPYDGYPEEYNADQDLVDRALIENMMGPDVYGVHVAMTPVLSNLRDIHRLCRENGIPFGAEFHVNEYLGKDGYEDQIREAARYTDYFSLNYFETEQIFKGVRDYMDAIELYSSFEVPCFLRVGTDGAYFIYDSKVYYSPMISAFGDKDPTGCGNTSTAAAFWAICSGYDPLASSYIGAIAASLNAGTTGVIEHITDDMRQKCRELLKKYVPQI